jgi:hypothetical protein
MKLYKYYNCVQPSFSREVSLELCSWERGLTRFEVGGWCSNEVPGAYGVGL